MTYPPPNNDPYGNQSPQYGTPQPPPYGAAQPPYGAPGYGAAPAAGYGSWAQRVGASLIDSLIVTPILIVAWVVGVSSDPVTGLRINGFFYIVWLLGLVVTAYNRWYLAGTTGQSWGRKALGIRLVSEQTGQPIGVGLTIGRDFVHIIDGIPCYIGYLWPLWDEKKQTFADKIMHTIVVR
jgi:uncharacterized RDD family membrane protein YckC